MRFLITLSYDGTNYKGYQTQPGLDTIQEKIENALTIINNGKKTSFTSSGRTDKGVHAIMQCGHADLDVNITEYKLKRAMNSNLPDDIHVIKTQIVSNDFHARYNVVEKTYTYYINTGEYDLRKRNYVFQYNYKLNVAVMKKGIKYLIGKQPDRALVEKCQNEKEAIYREMCLKDRENFVLAKGVVKFLDYVCENDIPHTIATMSEEVNVKFFIKEFNLAKWFDVDKIVYDNGKIKGKPAPDIYLEAAKQLNLQPKDCIVVEDALSGIEAAHKAGIGKIVAIESMETRELYSKVPAVDEIIADFDDFDRNWLYTKLDKVS